MAVDVFDKVVVPEMPGIWSDHAARFYERCVTSLLVTGGGRDNSEYANLKKEIGNDPLFEKLAYELLEIGVHAPSLFWADAAMRTIARKVIKRIENRNLKDESDRMKTAPFYGMF